MGDLNCTCYRLRKAARRVTQIYDRHLAESGLTANQFGILAVLARTDRIAMGALAEIIGADASTMTRNLRPLLDMGAVAFAAGGDRRMRVVRLTEAGRERLAAAVEPWRAAEREVTRALGQHDLAALQGLLGRLSEQLAGMDAQDASAGAA